MAEVTTPSSPNTAQAISQDKGAGAKPPYDIFICYRRQSAGHPAANLYEILLEAFGEAAFIDHECLVGGEHWRHFIDDVVAHTDTVVVLLTSSWFKEFRDRAEAQSNDEVLREIKLAMQNGKRLLPILLDAAHAPNQSDATALGLHSELSAVVQALANVQALPWSSTNRQRDIATIIDELSKRLPRFEERSRKRCQDRLAHQLEGTYGVDRFKEKFKAFGNTIPRPSLETEISGALEKQAPLLVVHAEEGMGKSIALGRALQSLSEENAVILSDASVAAWKDGFLSGCEKLLSEHFSVQEAKLALEQPLRTLAEIT